MAKATKGDLAVVVKKANLQTVDIEIVGTAPYVQNKFSSKARLQIQQAQEAGSTGKSKRGDKEARDFDEDFRQAQHVSREGWAGIPAPAFRSGMIDACRLVNFKMTHAKLSIFIEPDGFDADDGTPLVKIIGGEPKNHVGYVRLPNGTATIAARPMWEEWGAKVRITFDADQFTVTDVANLMERVGLQVGIGEGRPYSKKSNGMGWGIEFIRSGGDKDRLIHVPSVVKSEGHYQLGSVLVKNADEYDRAFSEASRKLEAAERAVDELRRLAGEDGDRIATLAFVRESMANARVALERIH